ETITVEANMGEASKRLQAHAADVDRIADIAIDLGRPGVIGGRKTIDQAGEGDRSAGIDAVPGVVDTEADAKLIPLAAAIDTKIDIVAGSRRVSIIDTERGLPVAADDAEAHIVEDGYVRPDKQTANTGIHR